ncbi:MAG: D-alanyl-D-alanine carboxypeptidase [Bacilli bacterium]|nr:D-alanyl-D-alanine carboxypeptidase [Bacilli bacterium]
MKKVIFFCACFFSFSTSVSAFDSALVMDADSGRILYSQNENKQSLIASTTKIMTALVVLNNAKLDDIVTAGDEIKDAYGSAIYIKPLEKMSVEDLLYGLMLRSGNDAALVLAKHTAGSVEGFAKLMNDTALMIGMKNTIFENPHGLDEQTKNKSTVYDMSLLMIEAMKNEKFREITSAKKHIVKTNFNTYEWYNKNRLLTDYKYATGGKIGYTTAARHTFVSSATKDDKNLVIATFVDPDRFVTHETLYEKYFDMYEKYTLVDKDNLKIDYKEGYKLYTTSSFSMLLTKEEAKRVKRDVELYTEIKEGTGSKIIGTISISLDGKTYKKLNLYGERPKVEVKKKSFFERIKDFFKW